MARIFPLISFEVIVNVVFGVAIPSSVIISPRLASCGVLPSDNFMTSAISLFSNCGILILRVFSFPPESRKTNSVLSSFRIACNIDVNTIFPSESTLTDSFSSFAMSKSSYLFGTKSSPTTLK